MNDKSACVQRTHVPWFHSTVLDFQNKSALHSMVEREVVKKKKLCLQWKQDQCGRKTKLFCLVLQHFSDHN